MSKSVNTICWVDIPVENLDRAVRFYSAVLGELIQKVNEHGFEFGLLPHNDDNVSGCLSLEGKPSEHGPLIYLNCEGRLEKALEEVKNLSGTIIKEKHKIGPYGYRAVIRDSEGNTVALYSSI